MRKMSRKISKLSFLSKSLHAQPQFKFDATFFAFLAFRSGSDPEWNKNTQIKLKFQKVPKQTRPQVWVQAET